MSMLALRATHLFDGERFLHGGVTVLVESGAVVAVQPCHAAVPEDTQVADYGDATILPGLIDTHVHLVGDSRWGALDRVAGYTDQEIDAVISEALRAHLTAGVTTVRDLGDRRWCCIERKAAQQQSTKNAEPTIFGSGPPITSRRGHCWYLGGEVNGPEEFAGAVAERVSRQVDIVKVMASGGMNTRGTDVLNTQFSDAELQLLINRAHSEGLPVTAHAHGLPAVEQAVAAGVDQIEHCTCLTPSGIKASNQLVESIADRHILVGAVLGYPSQGILDQAPAPVRDMLRGAGITFESLREMRLAHIARLHQAGITLVAGSDSGIAPEVAHGAIHRAVEVFAEAGATTEVALNSATAAGAQACGVADRKGFIRPGYDADVAIVEGDLRASLTNLTLVKAVFLHGQQVI
jgi:imidazolonepropionase-like amidohydrolase